MTSGRNELLVRPSRQGARRTLNLLTLQHLSVGHCLLDIVLCLGEEVENVHNATLNRF